MNNGAKILLVDDEHQLQDLLSYKLKSKGYKVMVADDGRHALDILKTFSPDLIILDLNMPKMTGIEFYQKICDEFSLPIYPVLILTARGNTEKLFKELDADGFVAKPFDSEHLLQEIATILSRHGVTPKKNKEKKLASSAPAQILVAENDPASLGEISQLLVQAGYSVLPARNGAEAIERAVAAPPTVGLIKFELNDIRGDVVIQKLKRIAKTEDIQLILYAERSEKSLTVREIISGKSEIDRFVEFLTARDLVDAVGQVLATLEDDDEPL